MNPFDSIAWAVDRIMEANMNAFDREEDFLVEELNSGRITRREFDREIWELRHDYRASAHEAAQDAYERELERW